MGVSEGVTSCHFQRAHLFILLVPIKLLCNHSCIVRNTNIHFESSYRFEYEAAVKHMIGWSRKWAVSVSFFCRLPVMSVSVSREDGCVSVFETPFLSFVPVISSPCRQSVSFSLSPPPFDGFRPQTRPCLCIPMTLFINHEHACMCVCLWMLIRWLQHSPHPPARVPSMAYRDLGWGVGLGILSLTFLSRSVCVCVFFNGGCTCVPKHTYLVPNTA